MSYSTIAVDCDGAVRRIAFNRPGRDNAISNTMVRELHQALFTTPPTLRVVVLEGSATTFCAGADFSEVGDGPGGGHDPERLYEVWRRLSNGPFVSIAHVRGRVTAGGVGFVAACDLALANAEARFSLTELLFGILPANVMPFLVRRIGHQRAHYLTLSNRVIWAEQARDWGLLDEVEADSERLLRIHLQRLSRIRPDAVARYKSFMTRLDRDALDAARVMATETSREMFADPRVAADLSRFARTGVFPWQEATSA